VYVDSEYVNTLNSVADVLFRIKMFLIIFTDELMKAQAQDKKLAKITIEKSSTLNFQKLFLSS
jgi:hypothetical protein